MHADPLQRPTQAQGLGLAIAKRSTMRYPRYAPKPLPVGSEVPSILNAEGLTGRQTGSMCGRPRLIIVKHQ
jgi:hypothetical protein